ncbi:hypothetical protein J6590_081685 [Homalodisca vitripennis]|nr:hypothetical protein J6590_081685 [Homalodisca vitripennis]
MRRDPPFNPYSARPHGPGLCESLIKQNKRESRYSTKSMVLIKSATVKKIGLNPRLKGPRRKFLRSLIRENPPE